MSRRNVDLGSGSVGKLLFSLAVPTITSQIVNMLYNLVDRVYIGHMQPVETVGKLARDVDVIMGAKDSSGDIENLKAYIRETRDIGKDFAVLAGNEGKLNRSFGK